MPRAQVSVNLDYDFAQYARAFAKRQQMPLSRIIEEALRAYIGEPQSAPLESPAPPTSGTGQL